MAAKITDYFTTAHGEADEGSVAEVKRGQKIGEIVCEGVVVISLEGLGGAAETPAIIGDDAIAIGGEEAGLILPGIGVKGPPVDEDDRHAGSPILVEDFSSILRGEIRHGCGSWTTVSCFGDRS